MREVKFRYTVKRDNGFIFSQIFTLEEIERGAVFAWANANLVDIEKVTKEQFTGFHYQDGREIYENDILELGGIPHVVVLRAGCFVADPLYDADFSSFVSEICQRCKRLGNIHENPEVIS